MDLILVSLCEIKALPLWKVNSRHLPCYLRHSSCTVRASDAMNACWMCIIIRRTDVYMVITTRRLYLSSNRIEVLSSVKWLMHIGNGMSDQRCHILSPSSNASCLCTEIMMWGLYISISCLYLAMLWTYNWKKTYRVWVWMALSMLEDQQSPLMSLL